MKLKVAGVEVAFFFNSAGPTAASLLYKLYNNAFAGAARHATVTAAMVLRPHSFLSIFFFLPSLAPS